MFEKITESIEKIVEDTENLRSLFHEFNLTHRDFEDKVNSFKGKENFWSEKIQKLKSDCEIAEAKYLARLKEIKESEEAASKLRDEENKKIASINAAAKLKLEQIEVNAKILEDTKKKLFDEREEVRTLKKTLDEKIKKIQDMVSQ